jgi:ribosomal protein S27AE
MVRLKVCFKCGNEKPIDAFYRHPRMGDGRLGKCIDCTKKDVGENRLKNIEKFREYDKTRARLPHRKALNAETNKAWYAQDIRRKIAHSAVAYAITKGELVRLPCTRCGNPKSVAHHEDYDRKLDVIWLCEPCHKQRHKEIDKELSATLPALAEAA